MGTRGKNFVNTVWIRECHEAKAPVTGEMSQDYAYHSLKNNEIRA